MNTMQAQALNAMLCFYRQALVQPVTRAKRLAEMRPAPQSVKCKPCRTSSRMKLGIQPI